MSPFRHLLLIGLLAVLGVSAKAQSGMAFDDLRQKLAPYFDNDLINDLEAAMPKGSGYRVWGWDVGDFTGDGFNDVAFSVNVLGTRRKECVVYLFADLDGFLVNVAQYRVPFVAIPLEVGVVIKENTCYVAQKRKAEDWTMQGYRYVQGSVVKVDEFVSNRVEAFAHDSYRNFQTLETRERFLLPDGRPAFATDFLTIPCYERGRQVFAGIVPDVQVGTIQHVRQGSFWWKGASDASFKARAVYDADFLYLRVAVRDSDVVTGWCDTCAADRLEIWFDVSVPDAEGGGRYITRIKRQKLEIRNESDSGLYAFSVKIGDFRDRRPEITVRTTDELSATQDEALNLLRVVTAPRAEGYVVKLRIPFVLLGFDRPPLEESASTELGCTIALYDVDNEFRPEETTTLSTSAIQPLDPSTYGAMAFIPAGIWYGETTNIFADAVLTSLRELGF